MGTTWSLSYLALDTHRSYDGGVEWTLGSHWVCLFKLDECWVCVAIIMNPFFSPPSKHLSFPIRSQFPLRWVLFFLSGSASISLGQTRTHTHSLTRTPTFTHGDTRTHTRTHLRSHTWTCAHTPTRTATLTHTHTLPHIQLRSHTKTHAHTATCASTFIQRHTHTLQKAYVCSNTKRHTHMLPHTHTYTSTFTYKEKNAHTHACAITMRETLEFTNVWTGTLRRTSCTHKHTLITLTKHTHTHTQTNTQAVFLTFKVGLTSVCAPSGNQPTQHYGQVLLAQENYPHISAPLDNITKVSRCFICIHCWPNALNWQQMESSIPETTNLT